MTSMPTESDKGKAAERLVHKIAEKSFFTDWCYLNPLRVDGDELCDLLVVYDSTAIIWQIKNVKVDRNTQTHKKSDFEKNIRQLTGAKRQLIDLKSEVILSNPYRGEEKVNLDLKEIHLVAVFWGDEEEHYTPFEERGEHRIHIFDQSTTEIVLSEQDTINDFLDYLRAREQLFMDNCKVIMNSEKDLLPYFLLDKKFDHLPKSTDGIIYLPLGCWENFSRDPRYISHKQKDEITKGWDNMIIRAREGSHRYELAARELARPNRFQRRFLSMAFGHCMRVATSDKKHPLTRHWMPLDKLGITYCFLFHSTDDREIRKAELSVICICARSEFPQNPKVVGIATEKPSTLECSYDFCVLENYNWTADNEAKVQDIRKKYGILQNPIRNSIQDDEF